MFFFTKYLTSLRSYPETGRARPSWDGPSMLSGSGGCRENRAETQRLDTGRWSCQIKLPPTSVMRHFKELL